MKLIEILVSGFYGFEHTTTIRYVDNRVISVGANGSGKSNVLRLIEFFLLHGTGPNVKLHWEQGDSAWEPHKQCVASLVFRLTPTMQDIFSKWRLTAILSLLLREKNVEQLLLDIEEQDIIDPSSQFPHVQIHPEEVIDEFGVENSPLFQKFKCNSRKSVRRVKLFWEMIEAALLSVYAERKPYDTAIYYAHTEARDRTSVVFQQILCSDKDRPDIMKQLNNVSLSDKSRLVFPLVSTIEEEIEALRQVLCGSRSKGDPNASRLMQFRGVTLGNFMPEVVWAEVEDHLRFGVPPVTEAVAVSTAPTPYPSSPTTLLSEITDDSLTTSTQTLHKTESHHTIIQKRVRRHLSGDLCLSNCGFTSSLIPGENPATISLDDVRSWCHSLLRKTEQFMQTRNEICRVCGVKGVNQILRRVLLNSVCILTQDRTLSQTPDYLMVTQDSVQSMFVKLLESGDRADMKAIGLIQEGMKSLVGQELQSHRYFRTGSFVIGLQPTGFHGLGGGLKSIGGGFKEVLMVLTALHGSGAPSVILDSPGFSLHPPQQKALALWMAKHSSSSLMIITNSTEFVTEDALPSLYCFRRISQPILQRYALAPIPTKPPKKRNEMSTSSAFVSSDAGVRVFEKPNVDSRVLRILDRDTDRDLFLYCRQSYNGFLHVADRSGYILSSELTLSENGHIPFSNYSEDLFPQDDYEIVTRVRPLLRSSTIDDSEMLRILDPALKRLVFATGVFFFEGQSDYRVIEALKHVANNVAWEIITMHGAGEIQKVANIVEALGIPYGIVVDYDQIMPTVNHVKQIDTVDMKLWKISSIHKYLSDRAGTGPPIPPTAPSSPVASSSNPSSSSFASKQADKSNAEEILSMLTSFRRNHTDDQELSQRLQQITSELKSSLQHANVYQDSTDKQPMKDKYIKVLEKIEKIIEDSGMHTAIRAALIRKELREVGIFTWNSDLEGMIFGYGDPTHCTQLISKMPTSMKQFCAEQVNLSGAAFANSGGGPTLSRPPPRDPAPRDLKKSAGALPPRHPTGSSSSSGSGSFDDVARVVYLIGATSGNVLLSTDLAKRYYAAFGTRFQCLKGGVPMPFSVLVERLQENPHIQITQIDSDGTKAPVRISRPVTPVSVYDEDEDQEEGDYDSPFAPLSEMDDMDNESETESVGGGGKFDEADEIAEAYEAKIDHHKNFRDALLAKKATPPRGKGGGGQGKGKTKDLKISSIAAAAAAPSAATPRKDRSLVSSEEDQLTGKIYKFQWTGESLQEPPDHIYQSPDYWTFVGSILHGAKDRGGMWKRLPWAVLKDVIASTKSVKMPENSIGKYLTADDLRRYGRQVGLVPLHIGLQDLVDWLDEMTARSLATTSSET